VRRDESLEYEELIGKYDFTHFGGSTDDSCQSELISAGTKKSKVAKLSKRVGSIVSQFPDVFGGAISRAVSD